MIRVHWVRQPTSSHNTTLWILAQHRPNKFVFDRDAPPQVFTTLCRSNRCQTSPGLRRRCVCWELTPASHLIASMHLSWGGFRCIRWKSAMEAVAQRGATVTCRAMCKIAFSDHGGDWLDSTHVFEMRGHNRLGMSQTTPPTRMPVFHSERATNDKSPLRSDISEPTHRCMKGNKRSRLHRRGRGPPQRQFTLCCWRTKGTPLPAPAALPAILHKACSAERKAEIST